MCDRYAPQHLQRYARALRSYLDAVEEDPHSYEARHMFTALKDLYERGITDDVLLPCFAIMIGKENAFLQKLSLGGANIGEDALQDIATRINHVAIALMNLRIGQNDPEQGVPTAVLMGPPRIPSQALVRVLLSMYRSKSDTEALLRLQTEFIEQFHVTV